VTFWNKFTSRKFCLFCCILCGSIVLRSEKESLDWLL